MEDFDRDKYKNLMHHVIHQAGERDGFGLTKLFKILWFFEARRFVTDGEIFSGARYTRDEHGPRPKVAYALLEEMKASGDIVVKEEPFGSRRLKRPVAKRPPRQGLLNETQARDLRYWIDYVTSRTAEAISEESHNYGWEIIPQGEDIPLVALLAERTRPAQGKELAWAMHRAKELGLP
jgi:hypothetical protein